MNKFLKAINVLVLSLGLISVNAQAVVIWVPTAHINRADNIYTQPVKKKKTMVLLFVITLNPIFSQKVLDVT